MANKGGKEMKHYKVKVIFQQENEFIIEAKDEQEIYRAVNEIGPLTNIVRIGEIIVSREKKGEMNRIVKEIS